MDLRPGPRTKYARVFHSETILLRLRFLCASLCVPFSSANAISKMFASILLIQSRECISYINNDFLEISYLQDLNERTSFLGIIGLQRNKYN